MLCVISVDKWSVQPSDCVVLLVSMYMVRCEAVLVVVMAVVIVFLYGDKPCAQIEYHMI